MSDSEILRKFFLGIESLKSPKEIQAEIKILRKSGKLDEAMQKGAELMEIDSENVWNKRAVSWVFYEYIKKYSELESYEIFNKNLENLKDLKLPKDEHMVYDLCAWQIGKLVFALQKEVPVDYSKIDEIFKIIKEFQFSKQEESFTFLFKAFHSGYKNWSNYLEFADWWNFENFEQKDYLEEEYKGKKKMSIVERACKLPLKPNCLKVE